MAEGSSPTNKLYAALALHLTGGAGATPAWMAFDSTDMLAYTATTNGLTGELSTGGIARGTTTVSLTVATTSVAADTCKAYLSCTPTGSAPIYGAGLFSASTGGDLLAWHRWAGLATVGSTDTIQETINIQEEIGV